MQSCCALLTSSAKNAPRSLEEIAHTINSNFSHRNRVTLPVVQATNHFGNTASPQNKCQAQPNPPPKRTNTNDDERGPPLKRQKTNSDSPTKSSPFKIYSNESNRILERHERLQKSDPPPERKPLSDDTSSLFVSKKRSVEHKISFRGRG